MYDGKQEFTQKTGYKLEQTGYKLEQTGYKLEQTGYKLEPFELESTTGNSLNKVLYGFLCSIASAVMILLYKYNITSLISY